MITASTLSTTSGFSMSSIQVEQLQKQVTNLQKEEVTEQNSQDNSQTKLQMENSYQEQIVVLQEEIQAAEQAQEQKAEQSAQSTSSGDGIIGSTKSNGLSVTASDDSTSGSGGTDASASSQRSSDTSRYLNVQA